MLLLAFIAYFLLSQKIALKKPRILKRLHLVLDLAIFIVYVDFKKFFGNPFSRLS